MRFNIYKMHIFIYKIYNNQIYIYIYLQLLLGWQLSGFGIQVLRTGDGVFMSFW